MENMNINAFSRIIPVGKLNENFTLCECYAFALGKNRNYSCITKDAAERALYGMDYLPIVANIYQDEEGKYFIGGHDYTIVEEPNGEWRFKPITVPVGVVIANSQEYRDVEEYGKTVTYVVVKCILWTEHYPELLEAAYSDEVYFSQSMEISVGQSRPLEEDSNYTEILDFTFLKLCLLGLSDDPHHNVEPCFISAKVLPTEFSMNNSDALFAKFKEVLDGYFAKEGKNMAEEELNIPAEEVPEEEPVVEEEPVEEPIVEEALEEPKPEEEPAEASEEEPVAEPAAEEPAEGGEGFAEEGAEESVVEEPVAEEPVAEEPAFDYEAEYKALKELYDALKAEYDELKGFKEEYDAQEHHRKVDEVLSQFEDMIGVSEFDEFALKAYEMENLESIESKCYELVGRFGCKRKKNKAVEKVTVPVAQPKEADNYYGDFFTKY